MKVLNSLLMLIIMIFIILMFENKKHKCKIMLTIISKTSPTVSKILLNAWHDIDMVSTEFKNGSKYSYCWV